MEVIDDHTHDHADNLSVPDMGGAGRLGRRIAMYRDVVQFLENHPGSDLLFYSPDGHEGVALNLSNAKELILGD